MASSADEFEATKKAIALETQEDLKKLRQIQNELELMYPLNFNLIESEKSRALEREEDLKKLKQLQEELDLMYSADSVEFMERKNQVDSCSIYVGNVDYDATDEELKQHFLGCGSINKVTIFRNKYTGQSKGYAFIEFMEKESVQRALEKDESLFRRRYIKVNPKKANPGIGKANCPPCGRGIRGAQDDINRASIYWGHSPYLPY